MSFGSFIPKKNGQRAPLVDPDATAVHTNWQGMLDRHLSAQDPQETTQFPRIEKPPPGYFPPQQPNIPQPKPYQRVHPFKDVPVPPNPPIYPQHSASVGPNAHPIAARSTSVSSSDVNAAIAQAHEMRPPEHYRHVRYLDGGNMVQFAVHHQIVSVNSIGVTVTPFGAPPGMRKLVPWHRVLEFDYDHRDPMMQSLR